MTVLCESEGFVRSVREHNRLINDMEPELYTQVTIHTVYSFPICMFVDK